MPVKAEAICAGLRTIRRGAAETFSGGVRDPVITAEALFARPARYGDSGVVTFIVNRAGVVRQKDLGPQNEPWLSLNALSTRGNGATERTGGDFCYRQYGDFLPRKIHGGFARADNADNIERFPSESRGPAFTGKEARRWFHALGSAMPAPN